VLIERGIDSREVECGAGNDDPQASIPARSSPARPLPYEDKYAADSLAQTRIPAAPTTRRERVRETAARLPRAECTGMARRLLH
jgi:D-alanine-D-alanine ligase-like ATP-grasp enzyme